MKKVICLLITFILLLCGCTQTNQTKENAYFTKNENGNIISPSGVEYSRLANEGILYYFGELEFVGSIKGEEKTSQHKGISYQTGMFTIKNNHNDNILIRYTPNNEWFSVYRKNSLSTLDFSEENCIRFEFVSGIGDMQSDAIHTICKGGITDKAEITNFLTEVRLQESPRDAGLYDLVKKPDGKLENCYRYGVIYGFFEDEPNLAIRMDIDSYNDLAYSISIGENQYILPESWLQKFINSKCTP